MGNEPTSFVDYIYDNNRNIIKEIRSYKTDTNKFIDIYKYDENNRLAERNGRIFYYYDSLGNLIYTIEHSLSEPVHNYRRDLKYDNNGRITELMQHNADGSIQFVKQNKYNYNGYLTEEYLNWEDAAYSDHRSLYEYDEKGNKIKIILFEGERKVRNSKYLYDNSGLLAEILNLDQYDNSASVYVFVYEYY